MIEIEKPKIERVDEKTTTLTVSLSLNPERTYYAWYSLLRRYFYPLCRAAVTSVK